MEISDYISWIKNRLYCFYTLIFYLSETNNINSYESEPHWLGNCYKSTVFILSTSMAQNIKLIQSLYENV